MIDQRFREHPKRRKKANAAVRKIKVIAGRLVRDLERKMSVEQLKNMSMICSSFTGSLIKSKKARTKSTAFTNRN